MDPAPVCLVLCLDAAPSLLAQPPTRPCAPTTAVRLAMQKRRNREGLLDADGVCAPGEVAAPNDILVNRQTPLNTKDVVPGMGHGDAALKDADYKPTPLAWKGPPGQNVVVDKVLLTNNEEGHMVVKARRAAPVPSRGACGGAARVRAVEHWWSSLLRCICSCRWSTARVRA